MELELVNQSSHKTYRETGVNGISLTYNFQIPGPAGEPFALHCSGFSEDNSGGNCSFIYIHGKKNPISTFSPEIETDVELRAHVAARFVEIIEKN